MAKTTFLTPIVEIRSPQETFGYPEDAMVKAWQNDVGEVHEIRYAGEPGVLFNNAPNQSELWDTENERLYFKYGTFGAIDGTWKYVAVAT